MGLLNFFFGKDPEIFDEQGRVLHKFPESKWKNWDARLKANPDYDWRVHKGKDVVRHEVIPANPSAPAASPLVPSGAATPKPIPPTKKD